VAELVALGLDVILASTTPAVAALNEITKIIPSVFVSVIDPVGSGGKLGAARRQCHRLYLV
jgi:putative ABC transport system substrate-binding protein